MQKLIAYIRAENEPSNKSITAEEKNDILKVTENIEQPLTFEIDEFIKRVYAKVISKAFDAYAEKSNIYFTIQIGYTDVDFADEQLWEKISLDFKNIDDGNVPENAWDSLVAPKNKNLCYLNIANMIYSTAYHFVR